MEAVSGIVNLKYSKLMEIWSLDPIEDVFAPTIYHEF